MMVVRLLVALLLICPAMAARAAESTAVTSSHDSVTLISADSAAAPGGKLTLGLRFRMQPGWHTYWSNPGDAGEPATIAAGLDGVAPAPVAIAWPVPRRLPDGPLMSYGYTGAVVLPFSVTAPAAIPPGGLAVAVKADWLVCASVCVPESGSFTLTLPAGVPSPAPEAALIAQAREAAPRPSPFDAHVSATGLLTLEGAGLTPDTVRDAWFLPLVADSIDQVAPQPLKAGDGSLSLSLKPGSQFPHGKPLDGVVVLRDKAGQETALSISATPATAALPVATAPASPVHGHAVALLRVLALAVAGGLILNLMPCVFPVLAMKAMAVVRLSGAGRRELRIGAGIYTLGVLVAFGALGAVTLMLRSAGGGIGWGFQFQSLAFVAAIAWLLFLVGLNLSGVFEIGTGAMGLGQGMAARRGHWGDFFTGLLAVVVAAPCTAPFMGVAIGSALASPAWEGMVIFFALGFGLALPYLLLAVFPGVARLMPRPGGWMDVLRRALAFPVYATVVWLAWVASQQGGPDAVLVLGAGLVLLALAAWLFGLGQAMKAHGGPGRPGHNPMRRARLCSVIALAALVLAVALLPRLAQTANTGQAATPAQAGTQPFSTARLDSLRQQGRPVLVDMSAAWCVTCLVNERLALSPANVRAALERHHVAVLRGDWTRRDPAITAYLASLGRDGVPLYVFYPAQGAPRVLPQILTADRVIREIGG